MAMSRMAFVWNLVTSRISTLIGYSSMVEVFWSGFEYFAKPREVGAPRMPLETSVMLLQQDEESPQVWTLPLFSHLSGEGC